MRGGGVFIVGYGIVVGLFFIIWVWFVMKGGKNGGFGNDIKWNICSVIEDLIICCVYEYRNCYRSWMIRMKFFIVESVLLVVIYIYFSLFIIFILLKFSDLNGVIDMLGLLVGLNMILFFF